ncbi:hypothetical protein LTR86_007475, partial [Recurvomyces mirabilis]
MPESCSFVPPHLLESIIASEENSERVRREAADSLEHHHRLSDLRQRRGPFGYPIDDVEQPTSATNGFIPEVLHKRVAPLESEGVVQPTSFES